MSRCWPDGTRTRASISRCCRAPTPIDPIRNWSARFSASALEEALDHYPGGSKKRDKAGARALGGDLTIIHSTWAWLEAQRQTGRSAIFRFRFDRAPLTPEGWFGDRPSKDAGAFHAGEILYVFNNLDAFPWLVTDDDQRLADLASGYWVNFVKTGDPNGPGFPAWPSYRQAGDPVMLLDATPAARRRCRSRPPRIPRGRRERQSRQVLDIGSALHLRPPCPCPAWKSPPRGRPAPCRRP